MSKRTLEEEFKRWEEEGPHPFLETGCVKPGMATQEILEIQKEIKALRKTIQKASKQRDVADPSIPIGLAGEQAVCASEASKQRKGFGVPTPDIGRSTYEPLWDRPYRKSK